MITCIVGKKGKGKTKHLLELTRLHLKNARGSIVYIDKNEQHMLELDSSIRLINAKNYEINSTSKFLGFILGMLSLNHDIELLVLDSLLTISLCDLNELDKFMQEIDTISTQFNVDFIISVSEDISNIPYSFINHQLISL